MISRLLQLASVHTALGVPWEAIQIQYTRGRKPYFVSAQADKSHAPNFNFNVSHEVHALYTSEGRLTSEHLFAEGQLRVDAYSLTAFPDQLS